MLLQREGLGVSLKGFGVPSGLIEGRFGVGLSAPVGVIDSKDEPRSWALTCFLRWLLSTLILGWYVTGRGA